MGTGANNRPDLIVFGGIRFAGTRAAGDHSIENIVIPIVRIVRNFVIVDNHMA
jgi:predicted MPP superfamily phosphohydrolase